MFFDEAWLTELLRSNVWPAMLTEETLAQITELRLEQLPEDLEELKKIPKLETLVIPQGLAQEKAPALMEAGYRVVIVPDGEVSP